MQLTTGLSALRPVDFSRDGHRSFALPCSRGVFECVTDAWKLPKHAFATFESRTALRLCDEAVDAPNGLSFGSHWFRVVMLYDPRSQTTRAFLASKGSAPENVLSDLTNGFQDAIPSPALLPLVCVEIEVRRYVKPYHRWIKGYLNQIRTVLGMNPYEDHDQLLEDAQRDLVHVMKRLTNAAQVITGLKFFLASSLKICAAAEDMNNVQKDRRSRPASSDQGAALSTISIRLHNLKALLEELQERMLLREQETQAQMQTLYTLVALRDNALSRQAADASVRLAEAATSDSADMRVIAGVTLFLPATFVATFFSTSFFDFHPGSGVVSRWVWLYWTVTAALTVLVLTGWIFVSRTMRKRSPLPHPSRQDDLANLKPRLKISTYRSGVTP